VVKEPAEAAVSTISIFIAFLPLLPANTKEGITKRTAPITKNSLPGYP
jgi:hypothetical protein